MKHGLEVEGTQDPGGLAQDHKLGCVQSAGAAPEAFANSPVSQYYPAIARSWRAYWEQVILFFSFSIHVGKAIYTTNAIQSLNSWMRHAVVTPGHFLGECSATKVIFIALVQVGRQLKAPAPY